MYFQEEYLSFLTDNEKEHFKKEFSGFLKLHGKREDATCCVILGNVTALSEKTRMFYVQTNEPSGNLYQVIVNTEQGFWEMESYEGEITDIEVYGGVREGDNIERIYIYENPEADVEIEIPTLEEEQEAKEKTYQELP